MSSTPQPNTEPPIALNVRLKQPGTVNLLTGGALNVMMVAR